jgi:hypothetical protein
MDFLIRMWSWYHKRACRHLPMSLAMGRANCNTKVHPHTSLPRYPASAPVSLLDGTATDFLSESYITLDKPIVRSGNPPPPPEPRRLSTSIFMFAEEEEGLPRAIYMLRSSCPQPYVLLKRMQKAADQSSVCANREQLLSTLWRKTCIYRSVPSSYFGHFFNTSERGGWGVRTWVVGPGGRCFYPPPRAP